MNHIIEDFTALSQELNKLEMERAKKLADSVNGPDEIVSNTDIYYSPPYIFCSEDFDPA